MQKDKIKIAIKQLEDAVELFLDKHSYESATTLAGAAEEILGKELKTQGKTHALEWQWAMQENIHRLFGDGPDNKKDFNIESNKVRNALKHYTEDDLTSEDIMAGSIQMIIRANENAARLNIKVKRIEEFEEWFLRNVIG